MEMTDMIIKENHIIDNVEAVKERLKELLKDTIPFETISLEEVKNFILTQPSTIFYFEQNLTQTNEKDKNAKIAWLDTGYCYNSEPVFLSLLKMGTEYVGHFVGTARYLVQGLIDHYRRESMYKSHLKKFLQKYELKVLKKRSVPHLIVEEQTVVVEPEMETETVPYFGTEMERKLLDIGWKISDEAKTEDITGTGVEKQISSVAEEIYGQLLYPNWKSIEGLERYIKVSGCRIKQLVEQDKTEYFVMNNIRSVVINTGLLDKFGTDYYVLYRYHEKYQNYIPYMVIHSKADYINNGFSKEDANRAVNLKPIQFVDAPMFFEATMDDFDINQKCLMHIIEERRNRFPESIREESADFLFRTIREALERGLKLQMRDHSYAKLTYSGKDGQVSWMLPLHIKYDFTKEPELVLVIRKAGEYYEVKTILPYDDALKDRITAMELYGKLW